MAHPKIEESVTKATQSLVVATDPMHGIGELRVNVTVALLDLFLNNAEEKYRVTNERVNELKCKIKHLEDEREQLHQCS